MEKFSTWRDKGTGISPFMPVDTPPSKTLTKALSLICLIVKLPVYYLCIFIYKVFPINGVISFILTKLFGLGTIEVTVDGLKKTKTKEIDNEKPGANNIALVNYISPITPLIIASIARVNWKDIIVLIPDANGTLYQYNIWETFSHALNKDIGVPTVTMKAKQMSSYKNKLIVLLAEGTPSNNRSLLPFAIQNKQINVPENFTFKVISTRLSPGYLTTPLPLISEFSYIVSLLCNVNSKSSVKVKIFNTTIDECIKAFDSNQLTPVGKDLNIKEKRKFFDAYLKVHQK